MVRAKMARRKPQKKRSLAPITVPADPEYSGSRGFVYLPQRTSGVVVNEDTGMTQSAVWACIRVISESLAGMPWRVGRLRNDGTIDPIERPGFSWLLNYQPNEETQSFAFRETLWAWALGWGNGYAEIERNIAGEPVALWQLHPSRVTPMRDRQERLVYEVTNDSAPPSYLAPRDMFHLMGPSPDGMVGWSVIRMHARTIGLAIAQEDNAASYNANDSTPGGVLKHPTKLSETAKDNLDKSWNRRHRGPNNRRTVAILEEGMEWQQTGTDPNDSKLIEQMQLTPAMICRIFRVPPHKIADLTRSTNNNIEHQDLEFVKDTLRPWAERGESEADVKLFGRNNQASLVTFIDLSERERGDTAAQTNHVERMTFIGVYSVNEGRKYLGLPSIGPEGDRRFIQSAMIPLEDAGKQQQSEPPEDSTDEPESESPTMDEGDTLAAVRNSAMIVLTDACRRMLKRENDAKNLDGEALATWIEKHREYSREALLPAAQVLSACLKANQAAAEVAVSLFLSKHLESREGTPEGKSLELLEYITAAASAKEAACQK